MLVELLVVGGTVYAGNRLYQQIRAKGRLWRLPTPQRHGWLGRQQPTVLGQPAPSPALQQANQMVVVSSSALGLTAVGVWLTLPALTLVSLPLMLYVFAPTFQAAWSTLRHERRINNQVLDATRITLCVIMHYDLVAALNACLQALSQKFFAQAEDDFRRELALLYGEAQTEAWLFVNGAELPTPLSQVTAGAIVVAGAGDTIPADGVVLYGAARLDQRLATGERQPVWKGKGERVAATSVVEAGRLYVQLEQSAAPLLADTIRQTLLTTVDQKTIVQRLGEQNADRIADDVGLGKSIEGGLVMQELIIRGRGRRILIVCPAALQIQWQEQMRDKFGLDFRIVDSALMHDSQRTDAIRVLAPHFEHRLFLTATPHNGYSESFSALLELLDNQRFARGVPPEPATLAQVMVRRLKTELQDDFGQPRFPGRHLVALGVAYTEEERTVHRHLQAYTALRRQHAKDEAERTATEFVLKLLKKRLFSSPAAFALTLAKHQATVSSQEQGKTVLHTATRPAAGVLRARLESLEETETDDSAEREATDNALSMAGRLFTPLAPTVAEPTVTPPPLTCTERTVAIVALALRRVIRWPPCAITWAKQVKSRLKNGSGSTVRWQIWRRGWCIMSAARPQRHLRRAVTGTAHHVPGLDITFEAPLQPEATVDTDQGTPEESAAVLRQLDKFLGLTLRPLLQSVWIDQVLAAQPILVTKRNNQPQNYLIRRSPRNKYPAAEAASRCQQRIASEKMDS